MPKFEPVNSIAYKCEADDLKHGQHLWAVMIETEGKRNKKESLSVVPCVVIRRHDDRVPKTIQAITADISKMPTVFKVSETVSIFLTEFSK